MESLTVTMAEESCSRNLVSSCLISVDDMLSRCSMYVEDLKSIQRELNKMKLLLRALKNGGLQGLNEFCEIRNWIYDAEDMADEIVNLQEQRGWLTWLNRLGFKWKLGRFSRSIQIINCRLELELLPDEKLRSLLSPPSPLPGKAGQRCLWKYEEDAVVVGMEDATQQISRSNMLVKGSKELKIVAIVGMAGVGKTTLARKVFNYVRHQFDCVGWAFIGRNFRIRRVLEDLLVHLGQKTREDMSSDSDLNLAEELFDVLQPRKYLIVLDDIWSVDDWECIKIAFPCSESTGSRVMLTTRSLPTALATKGSVHQMSGLDEEQSFTLLSATAFGTHLLDSEEFAKIGRDIARKCSGLPLAVKVVGGLLASGMSLEMVLNSLVMCESKSGSEQLGSVLNLAYDDLPSCLKLMFLYFGIFQRGEVIDAERLYLLWSAEGFLSPFKHPSGKESMLDVAEWCLYQLCIRNLVQVQKQEVPTGRCFKSCSIHDLIYDLCLIKQCESYFFVDLSFGRSYDIKESPSSLPHPTPKIRRLSLSVEVGFLDYFHNSDVNDRQLSPIPADTWDLSSLRVLYACNYLTSPGLKGDLVPLNSLQPTDLSEMLLDFSTCESLTVLHCNGFRFNEASLPATILKLTRLRYLCLRNCHIRSLPSTICSLANLETLDIQECTRTKMILPSELQKSISLRYLYLPCNFEVRGGVKLRLSELVNLEILVNFDAAVSELKDLCKLTKLKKLVASIGGELQEMADMRYCMETSLNSLIFISLKLRKLADYSTDYHAVMKGLLVLNLNVLQMEGHLGKLPLNISVSLSELSLSGSELKEDPLEKLEKLPNLLILTLQYNAFLGKCMTCSVSGMPQLRCLSLLNLDNLESLAIIEGGMPKLSTLAIDRCQRLKDLPEALNSRKRLLRLKVLHVPQ